MITGPDNVYTARERQRGYELAIQESSKARSAQQSDLKGKTDRTDTKLRQMVTTRLPAERKRCASFTKTIRI